MRTALMLVCVLVLGAFATGCGGKKRVGPDSETRETERRDASDSVEKLGSRKVDFKGDRDTIVVGAHEGTFEAIRLDVDGSAMEMWDIVITYGNGDKHSPTTRLIFGENSWSRRIDLPGGNRIIKKIEFAYKSRNVRTGRATVTVYGVH